jgi:hypothetical protein
VVSIFLQIIGYICEVARWCHPMNKTGNRREENYVYYFLRQ